MSGRAARASKARKRRPLYLSYFAKLPSAETWNHVQCEMQPFFHPYRKRFKWPSITDTIRFIELQHHDSPVMTMAHTQITRLA